MLLRRITKHVTDQNWFAVFIDFLIVVVGVFIGIQVANWNEERNNRALEDQYLERLFSDLNGSIDDFNKNFIFDQTRLDTQYTVLKSLRNGVLDEKDIIAFSSGLAWAGIHNPQRRRWGTVNELFSTGNISLIQDLELRQELSALGAWYDRNNEIVKASVARIVPLRNELTKKYQILRYSPSASSVSEVIFEFNDLKQDNEFINTFANLYLESDIIVNFSWASMERFQILRDKLVPILNVESEGLPVLANQHFRPWENKAGVKK